MKQILQSIADGTTSIVEIPCPNRAEGAILSTSRVSLVSAGTERMLIDFGKANYFDKVRQQPDKVKQVFDKIRTDGLLPTISAVRSKLDQPLPLGYCNVGVVLESDVNDLKVGDRVVSNGHHAEIVNVPHNLCAKIPANVTDEVAVFTVIGAIALQGIRLAAPTLGESFVVTGLGLVGLMAVQLLRAHGCRVLGIDFESNKCELARKFGADTVDLSKGEDPVAIAMNFSRGRGVDGVLITASSKSNEPVHQAALMCRQRGRIVLVGVVGLELSRADFFKKELTFQVSCSYGPGRHDSRYESQGQDYPFGYVRWTEQRNFEAVIDMMSEGKLNVEPLISHRFSFDNALEAYKRLIADRSSLGILLQYKKCAAGKKTTILIQGSHGVELHNQTETVVGFLGAGNYAARVLIPAFKKANASLLSVASSGGVSSTHAGQKYGFCETTTDTEKLIKDPRINTIVISTRHDSHADLVCKALEAGKHVFVEKPLCLTTDELEKIEAVYLALQVKTQPPLLMVGFNRRFAPHIKKLKSLLAGTREPKSFIVTVNAGAIPADHWTQDNKIGGGRIIGEACHFIDLLRFLAGHAIESSSVAQMGKGIGDTVSIALCFVDGSIGTIHYYANGSKKFPKERLEVFTAGRILQLDNFRFLRGFGWTGFNKMRLWSQDKGQNDCADSFLKAIRAGTPSPIPFDEIIEVSRVSIELSHAS